MFNNVVQGQYIPGDSFLHKLDPRTKFLAFLILIIIIFKTNIMFDYILITGLAVLIAIMSGIRIKVVFRGIKPFFLIIFLTVFLQIILIPGDPIFTTSLFTITRQGLISGAVIGYRLFMVILITNYLTLTTSPVSLTDGLEEIFRPLKALKIPVSELALMITITLRFIPTLMEEADKIIKAQASRGAEFESGSILKRSKNLVSLLVPLLVSSIKRAEELATAMESRGYSSGQNRTRMNPLVFKRQDYITVLALALFLLTFYLV